MIPKQQGKKNKREIPTIYIHTYLSTSRWCSWTVDPIPSLIVESLTNHKNWQTHQWCSITTTMIQIQLQTTHNIAPFIKHYVTASQRATTIPEQKTNSIHIPCYDPSAWHRVMNCQLKSGPCLLVHTVRILAMFVMGHFRHGRD